MENKRPDGIEQEMPDNAANQAENKEKNPETAEATPEGKSELEELEQQLKEMKDKYLYLLSDFENFKRNVAKERIELQQTAGRDIMTALLPVLDDFDRAAKNDALNEGTVLIHHKLKQTLQGFGLSEIASQPGDVFSPDIQEAIAEIPAPSKKMHGKIVEIIDKGYQLGSRIIRYAKVVVGK